MSRHLKLLAAFGWTLCQCPITGAAENEATKASAETETKVQPSTAPRSNWAFKPLTRPEIPKVRDNSWARNPVDHFIPARLQEKHLSPSPEADRATLIRRLSFNLTGLPPTPEEVDRFVHDRSSRSHEDLVERLLASPRYGERWARHWLDVVRFAETHGFEMNQPRPNAWPYRDYVIRAFNEDKPYDRFILEQLAGNALGVEEATGFLVGGPWDQVKSPDMNLTLQQRMDELHDMVNTASTAFLGLTVGCARCHDHKFDPIPQTDYYAMQAVFAGVQHGERTLRTPDYDERMSQAAALRQQVRAARPHPSFEPRRADAKAGSRHAGRPHQDRPQVGAAGGHAGKAAPPCGGALDHRPTESSNGPRHGQPHLAISFRPGIGGYAE